VAGDNRKSLTDLCFNIQPVLCFQNIYGTYHLLIRGVWLIKIYFKIYILIEIVSVFSALATLYNNERIFYRITSVTCQKRRSADYMRFRTSVVNRFVQLRQLDEADWQMNIKLRELSHFSHYGVCFFTSIILIDMNLLSLCSGLCTIELQCVYCTSFM
jgi:hypothetical protein